MREPSTRADYRPDIDGLRAVAVLSVVGFHVAPGRIPGGFSGVDIFFVISGFLISTIIFKGLEDNNFSLTEFYGRRIKRIFPALLVVLLACFAFGWFALLADEYKQLGEHIAGGAGFVSNLVLWRESGYFDNTAEMKPLLHLWSLSIEEQFYIFWPLLLAFMWRRRWSFIAITSTVAAVSFAVNIYAINRYPTASFYLPFARFWELMVGGMLAYIALHKPHWNSRHKNAQAFLGATLLLIGFVLINQARAFPGWWALLPTSGTFLVISAGPSALFNSHVLSNKAALWVGLISYPLYLWHWPMLSFLRILHGGEAPQADRFVAVLVSFALAWLTYVLVERPLRLGSHGRIKIGVLIILMTVLGGAGYAGYTQDGFKSRATLPQMANNGDLGPYLFFNFLSEKYGLCTPDYMREDTGFWNGFETCYQSQKNSPLKVAIIGDSHAQHLFPGLAEELAGTNVVVYTKTGLPLLSNNDFDKIFKYLISDGGITTVIIAARWGDKINDASKAGAESELLKTVDYLTAANKLVYIFDDVPNFPFEASKCKYAGRLWQKNRCLENIDYYQKQLSVFWPIQKSIKEKNPRVKVVRVGDYFCNAEFCGMANNGILLYRDSNHLNVDGSKYLGRRIKQSYPEISGSPSTQVP